MAAKLALPDAAPWLDLQVLRTKFPSGLGGVFRGCYNHQGRQKIAVRFVIQTEQAD